MDKKHVFLAGLIILILSVGISLKTSRKKTKSADFEDGIFVIKKKLRARKPSSLIKAVMEREHAKALKEEGPGFSISEREDVGPQRSFESKEKEEEIPSSFVGVLNNDNSNQSARSYNPSFDRSKSPSSSTQKTAPVKSTINFGNVNQPSLMIPPGTSSNNNSKNPSGPNNKPSDSPSTGNDTEETPPSICNANIGGGSFNSPISVELTCSNTSNVKYCVSEGSCCNPEMGLTYSGPISIGQPSKTFCLSFTGGDEISEATYSFNADLPHLDVLQKKLQVQTTQLDEQLILMSHNFGSNDHSIGLVNFRQSDPVAMNLTCEEAVQYVPSGWAGSGSLVVLPETPVGPYTAMDQINVMMNLTKLSYGNNNLVSYVKSSQYVEEQYACVHTKMILRDFFYFESLPIEVSTDHYFVGGFSPIGPGEDNTLVYRGPASDISTSSLEELRSGLLSIFYDK